MDTNVFGKLSWETMNLVAWIADQDVVSQDVVSQALVFFSSLTMTLPCEPCRKFYLTCWCIHPPSPQSSLLNWVYDIHAIVSSKIKVTKNNIICPKECLAPCISRQEMFRRLTTLGRGSNISVWSLLDFILIMAHGCKRHEKDKKRKHAWLAMMHSLAKVLGHSPEHLTLSTKILETISHRDSPWKNAVKLYTTMRRRKRLPVEDERELWKRLDNACGPLCECLKREWKIK